MKRILIAEDDRYKMEDLEKDLKSLYPDAEFLTASNGVEGMCVFRQNPCIDGIVTDLDMPGGNGEQFVRDLRSQGYEGKILINSNVSSERIRQAIDAGADALLPSNCGYKERINFLKTYFK